MAEIVKEYTNGELTVVWKPAKCIHAGICVKTLPDVYDPKGKPWIKPENASTQALKEQVSNCPSGALTSYMNAEGPQKPETIQETKVDVMTNGPLLVHGDLTVNNSDGSKEEKNNVTAFCRCGASANKPYCDGTHGKVDFKG